MRRSLRSSFVAVSRTQAACLVHPSRTFSSRSVSVPDSRTREIDLACAALVESVHAGDRRWLDRIVNQLHGILMERREALVKDSEHATTEGARIDNRSWKSEGEALVKDSDHATAEGARIDTRSWRRESEAPVIADKTPAGVDFEEQPWAAALRLLEEATLPRNRLSRPPTTFAARDPQSTPTIQQLRSPPQPSATETPDRAPEMARDDSNVPPWEAALRMLEMVGLDRKSRVRAPQQAPPSSAPRPAGTVSTGTSMGVEHEDEDLRMARYERMLNKEDVDTQHGRMRRARMNQYMELLKDAPGHDASPGASLPVRTETSAPSSASSFSVASSAPQSPIPPPPLHNPSTSWSPPVVKTKNRKRDDHESLTEARGRGHLEPAMPGPADEEVLDDATLRKEDFIWSEHEFNDGPKENKRVLRGFKAEFKKMVAETPDGLRNSRLLTAALDLALAYVKNYELDKAEAIYRRAIGECRRRGLPWDVKCIQDMATLRCKQHRQADAAELLEELATKAPPHPATFINLGTVYNQLKQFDKAESWFLQAVNLKGGSPGREDLWNLGICKKNMKKYNEALPMLEQALTEFQEHEPEHPVTIAKLHCSVAGCLYDMGRAADAIVQYRQAYDLYVGSVGKHSPLFCGTAEGLAKALNAEGRMEEAFEALVEAFEVLAKGDAVHPTPLFENLELALSIYDKQPKVPLAKLAPLIDAAVENLDKRGQAEDGNAGLVMSRGAKVLSRAGGSKARACALLQRGKALIQGSHDAGEADLWHEIASADMLLRELEGS